MILPPLDATLCMALALILAGQMPRREWAVAWPAVFVCAASFIMCEWACVAYLTPAQMIYGATGQLVDPYKLFALQDAIASAWLASVYYVNRSPVVGTVGALFGVDVVVHLMGASGAIPDRQPYIDTLFVAQLICISWHGAGASEQRIRDWLADYRAGSMGVGIRLRYEAVFCRRADGRCASVHDHAAVATSGGNDGR